MANSEMGRGETRTGKGFAMTCPFCAAPHRMSFPSSSANQFACGTFTSRDTNRHDQTILCVTAEVDGLNARIARLETAGDALARTQTHDLVEVVNWRKARESKP